MIYNGYDGKLENDGPYTLKRDGQEIISGTWAECVNWIHSHHCYSAAHACAYEGYEIKDNRPNRF